MIQKQSSKNIGTPQNATLPDANGDTDFFPSLGQAQRSAVRAVYPVPVRQQMTT